MRCMIGADYRGHRMMRKEAYARHSFPLGL